MVKINITRREIKELKKGNYQDVEFVIENILSQVRYQDKMKRRLSKRKKR